MKKLGVLAIALGTMVSTATIATPAAAVATCATDYKIVSVSIKYKGCLRRDVGRGEARVNGLRLNDHGSTVKVEFQYALRDLDTTGLIYGEYWHTQSWPAGKGTISKSNTFPCIPGNRIRGLLHVKVNGKTGAWSESPVFTCPR